MSKTIAVIDDEQDILELVTLHLKNAGYKVRGFQDGETFMKYLTEQKPDLIILDLMLPDIDGMDICKYLRQQRELSGIPVIMLTAKSEETDKVMGLELGADDYVTKPFSPRELIARTKAILRRSHHTEDNKALQIGSNLVIDLRKYEVTVGKKKIDLTSTEFRILALLAQRIGWVYTRDQILEHLWGTEKIVLDRTVDVHIKNLREKLGAAKTYLKNIRGVGYKLEE